ncbi:MAG: SUMF1/EgtB/PvdO family nonheme iron enzyme [Myxococcaceae bacterium]|nr:SUMF1/EgtB/PvdO family nonheme iron enzyme [Myxococcaceae bacterium]MCA3015398.1 SUMF1/EgtB/PvdO family nonheme iron enzyme [Myxococcaceae bacterium]
MLCYRCGSHVADGIETCPTCGQKLAGGGLRQATGTFSRRKATSQIIEGAPYRPQDLVANRYLVKDVVGAGPLGVVFRAHDKEVDVEVALKVVNARLCQTADERRTFAKQLRLARKLSHPNLVRVYEEGEDQDRPFFTSQFLDGLTLRKIIDLRLQKGQFFALHEIEPILSQVCSALDGAHKVGPHTSIKPDNVLVLPDLLKVTDFGLGLALPRLPYVQAMKSRKADRYLSPEMVDGGEVDGRTDVYSVGVILGEMLSGLTPDGAAPELQRRNPNVPQAIEGLYRKAINSNPNARFKTAGELFAEFSGLVKANAPAPAAPQRPEPATGAPPPLRPRTTTGMLQLQPRREKPPPPLPALPPPPPSTTSGETPLVDSTQPVDSRRIDEALRSAGANQDAPDNREETAVIDSGKVLASLDADDHAETNAVVDAIAPPIEPVSEGKTWVLVLLLVVLGVGIGAGGGYFLIQRKKHQDAEEVRRRAEEERLRQEAARRDASPPPDPGSAAQPGTPPTVTATPESTASETLAAARAAAANAERDRLAADKAAAEKAAADKAAAEKAAADKAAAEKAAADKAAADKAAAERAASGDKTPRVAVATPVKPAGGEGCPEGMRAVAAGVFRMGTSRDDPMMGFDEKVLTAVEVPAFCIDAYEYPNRKGASPMVSVSFQDAKRLCEAQTKRLCGEAEWEKACKGPASAKWPFGNAFDADACNTEDDAGEARSLAPAGRFGKCRSGYGVGDQSGNVAEWTSDRIIKGGSFASGDYAVRCAARKPGASFNKSGEVGFRCCADPK